MFWFNGVIEIHPRPHEKGVIREEELMHGKDATNITGQGKTLGLSKGRNCTLIVGQAGDKWTQHAWSGSKRHMGCKYLLDHNKLKLC